MLEPSGLGDHSFASLLAEPPATMPSGGHGSHADSTSPSRAGSAKGTGAPSSLVNGCEGGSSSRCSAVGGREVGGGGREAAGSEQQQQQQVSGVPPPLALPPLSSVSSKCEASSPGPYTLPSGPYTLPSSSSMPPALTPTANIFSTIYTTGLPHHQPPEPRDVFAAPFSAITFPFQVNMRTEDVWNGVCVLLMVTQPACPKLERDRIRHTRSEGYPSSFKASYVIGRS